MDKEINLKDILEALRSKIALILAVTIVFGLAAYAYFAATTTDKYSAQGRILCNSLSETTADSSLGQSAISASEMLSKTVLNLLASDAFLQGVASALESDYNIHGYTSGKIANNLVVSQIEDTFILIVTVVADKPEVAVAIVNEIGNQAGKLAEDLGGGNVRKFETTEQIAIPRSPIDTRMGLKSLLAALVGFVFIVLIVVVAYLADDKIKNQQEILNKYNVPIVGVIPARYER